jgi:predicted nucleotidyltransferase
MDIASLLKLLNEKKVKYVIIGATAFPAHGYTRATADIDFFIEPTLDNAQRTLSALTEFGYDTHELSIQDLLEQKILIRGYGVEADIHPFVKGIENFNKIWESKISTVISGEETFVADLDSLILMKQSAGRPKDLDDLHYLLELKKQN